MITLTEQIAQSIVDRMMNVIPYNVNIMNSEGIIIGSGDKSRIGHLHEGAAQAIAEDKLIAVYESKGGAKPGVNMPIHFDKKIMGVIGISGEPKIVEAFASIVKVTAELLINQEYAFNERRIKEQMKEEFLYQWAYLSEDYDESFVHRASKLNIDLNINRLAVVIKTSNEKAVLDKVTRYLQENEYVIRLNPENILIFMKADSKINKRVNLIYEELKRSVKIGIGIDSKVMVRSVEQALNAIYLAEKLNLPKDICSYSEISFIDILSKSLKRDKFSHIISRLEEESKTLNLIETLTTYILLNGEVNHVAEALHIHRNSLNYRLKKIEDITGKNPRNLLGLFELFTACILYKLD
ncbi:helix-turn-helix domain-containing protein [Clostridium sp. SYSU_GA19001]|uniref:CdaR family transcriptional regulator n=1 Tax=Clostridium caldaquaticum TaxID=2940653 RepID=UPI0020771CD5|nr:sugar diacid recognition domain-containing protein [Clostridium caldaquaticum]MCM8710216.1 helix-turn-helix domain-containing protein [Clostridium caldaquaticum]